ncbi:short-chain dehydrogenase [Mycolicibacterium agri]|uniref:3-oxoacyl-[acyl-carrier-protein] reductase MabA n=1 Tax=Mycolicibacterium agri TaxID=36811 RepID=A0A2A7N470_MYCAG|nr:SDR family oxidoreductase [Mycolicibacterium agri]PEG38228.1 short-chain dehydrogenase [Mycolicibacterium agri]GFG49305.1 3-oxoacyl-ACP reductase [Mycolicibacterium agri]
MTSDITSDTTKRHDRRVALVTGATQGIGAAIAERLAAEGATVGVNGPVRDHRMDAVVRGTGGFPAAADVSDPDAVTAMVADIERTRGPVDILVCNAAYMTMGPFVEHPDDDWWKILDTNLSGTVYLVQAVLDGMRRRGGGNIVIIASEWGVIGWPNASAYSASKAGLISLTKALGRELAPERITVNAIAPGIIDTPQLQVDADDAGLTLAQMHEEYAREIPLGRIGRPAEIAAAVSLLARDDLTAFVGQTIQINGGTTRCRT